MLRYPRYNPAENIFYSQNSSIQELAEDLDDDIFLAATPSSARYSAAFHSSMALHLPALLAKAVTLIDVVTQGGRAVERGHRGLRMEDRFGRRLTVGDVLHLAEREGVPTLAQLRDQIAVDARALR